MRPATSLDPVTSVTSVTSSNLFLGVVFHFNPTNALYALLNDTV